MTDLTALEQEIRDQGFSLICGVDEAGRGPLAGPVSAACVIFPQDVLIDGVNDSKKLTEKRREALFDEICAKAVAYGIGWASEGEIDTLNILGATYLAMNRAIGTMGVTPEIALIDGNRNQGIECASRCIIGGDSSCLSIAAASILAKVSRDRLMLKLHDEYPQYGFDRHKGYPTRAHYAALNAYGPSPVHRQTFLKKWRAGAVK